MSRHSRTSTASAVLKLCNDNRDSYSDDDLNTLRALIMDSPDLPEQDKSRIIDLVTIVVLKHELYKNAITELQSALQSISDDI